ncbi:purine and uridine phosphorylase [Aspergillus germanicus]
MSDPKEYTVGWICAIRTEFTAAQAFLDEKHQIPEALSPADNNAYTVGMIGKHKVVIAVLPDGEYGISSAAGVARDMLHSFPNIKIGLMVGIGGGAPSPKHDIRLGDIVVSATRGGKGGVLQYDFGKAKQNQDFETTGVLNQPPTCLRTALSALQSDYESDGHQLEESVNRVLAKKPRLQKKYKRPDPDSDRLYKSEFVHPLDNEANCAVACGDGLSHLIMRHERAEDEDNPAIHYGLIASSNQLMKDASIRDRLAAQRDVLCFEMEAAGLVNHFPCLVIRGICDYADSHKNKEWQGYAAMVAAAYTKDLLHRIPPNRIEAEKKIGDVLSGLQAIIEDHRDIAHKQLELHEHSVKERLSEKQYECLQVFRLTTGDKDATYEWYKDRAGDRVEGTCEWFLNHENFQWWLKQESGPLLVSADPGCGKTVLARYLIDNILPKSSTICYFFFKDQDQNTVRQALCAILHQLFAQKLFLIGHAMDYFRINGTNLTKSTTVLWNILEKALKDPQAGPVIILLDALDECAESEFEDLVQNVKRHSLQSNLRKLKFLLTSRPYEQIIDKFRDLLCTFPQIRIPGEEKSEEISQEVSHVIHYRVEQLAKEKGLSELVKNHLAERLLTVTHRTYLWVYLVFDHLKAKQFKKTLRGLDFEISTLPANVNEAYDQILRKSKEQAMVRRALNIILAASRPLTISEMNIALNVNDTSKCIHDLDLEEKEDFGLRLRTGCGLFISIHHDKIYFLHQTAREFLLGDTVQPVLDPSGSLWQHSITIQSAHNILAEICVIYLNFFNVERCPPDVQCESRGESEGNHDANIHTFLSYAAENWGTHSHKACIGAGSALVALILSICSPHSMILSVWFRMYWKAQWRRPTEGFNSLMISSYFGIEATVELLLEKGAETESKDKEYGRTPLSWATENGHETIVKLLLENGASFDSKDNEGWNKRYGRTALALAVEKGHESIVELLLEKGAAVGTQNREGRTPLFWAVGKGHDSILTPKVIMAGPHYFGLRRKGMI